MSFAVSPGSDLSHRISATYGNFGQTQRMIADFVLQRPLDAVVMNIEALAAACLSSPASITRFVRHIGYSGYAEFRSAISEAVKLTLAPAHGKANETQAVGVMRHVLETQSQNLQALRAGLDVAHMGEALGLLLAARRIFILGTGASYPVAIMLEEGLALYLDANITLATARGGPELATRHMMACGEGDVVVGISLPRYSRSTIDLVELAQRRGARIIALTDKPTSPLAQHADIALFTPAQHPFLPNSPVAAFCLAEAIVAAIIASRPDASTKLAEMSKQMAGLFQV